MSHPSRPQARVPAQRRRRKAYIEAIQELEDRQLLAPFFPINTPTVTFTPVPATQPNTQSLGTVSFAAGPALATSAGAYTGVSEFTPLSSFGGDIVRIEAGPGGDFGKGVYAITRGAGENAGQPGVVNHPGVIYRVDPATGKSSVFFDLNTVISQLEPGGNAGNGLLPSTGLTNWYDIAFDPEGYFDGRPSMFVTSSDRSDPNKNAVYRISPDGSFMGLFVAFNSTSQGLINRSPTSVFVPPAEQQQFLRGVFVGNGNTSGPEGGAVLFFDANTFRPGQVIGTPLAPGVSATAMTSGPQVAIAGANNDYLSPVYSVFTNFGTPPAGGLPGAPGVSGIQGLGGESLIPGAPGATFQTAPANPDTASVVLTPYRRFQDAAFDYYGYFSYGATVTPVAGSRPTVGTPTFAGSFFVTDLAAGFSTPITVTGNGTAATINVPVQGPGGVGIAPVGVAGPPNSILIGQTNVNGVTENIFAPAGNFGGRVLRITPGGQVSVFASGFRVSGSPFADSFQNSSLSITFSADGTTLYVADDDAIWQFKAVTDIANATSGSLIGLNDLRTFGVPYEGQDSAIDIVDTGVDGATPNFRGRVAPGKNVVNNTTPGNDDTVPATLQAGHGTPLAGVVAQFVPQATLNPVNIFATTATAAPAGATNVGTTNQLVYEGMNYVASNPFVKDPIRPNKADRVIASTFGFGTQRTFNSEGAAYRTYPQVVAAFKNQLHKFRDLGIAPIAAAGQFGTPSGTLANPNGTTAGIYDGMPLPATLNEVISVTGSYPFPFTATALSSPDDPGPGTYPRPLGPVLVTTFATGTGTDVIGSAAPLTVSDVVIFKDKLLVSSNRSTTTDFTAPELDLPTFRRTLGVAGTAPEPAQGHNVFTQGGTSLSAGVLTGSYAVVASALDYWTKIAAAGTTVDGYLTTPIGVRQLNFGPHQLTDLSAYANTDGINSILQWTAVPVQDSTQIEDATVVKPAPMLFGNAHPREISRVDVGNAIGAIEATIALRYLFAHGDFNIIDANHDGLITAQELQTFEDESASIGLPEAGAMARLLGGTARTGNGAVGVTGAGISVPGAGILVAGSGQTLAGETPDQPDALKRRFNLLDFAADGQLNGAISTQQLLVLSHYLLPTPDAFTVIDRQRASANGYLIDPHPYRNFSDLQHIQPTYEFVPPGAIKRFRGISPNAFGVGRKLSPRLTTPVYTLFNNQGGQSAKQDAAPAKHAAATTAGTGSEAANAPNAPTTGAGAGQAQANANTPTQPTGTGQSTAPQTASLNPFATSSAGPTGNPIADALAALAAQASSGTANAATSTPAATIRTTPFTTATSLGQTRPITGIGLPTLAGTITPLAKPTTTPGAGKTTSTSTKTTTPAASLPVAQAATTAASGTPSAGATSRPAPAKKSKSVFGHLFDSFNNLFGHKKSK
jgi:hypothetical protein